MSQLGAMADSSPRVRACDAIQRMADRSPQTQGAAQLQEAADRSPRVVSSLVARMEGLSGVDLSDVRVHYDSPRPLELEAHAFAKGSDIHLGPGQQHHLPHEMWHVVQQKQGRVPSTRQFKGESLNESAALEREADVMGARALALPKPAKRPRDPTHGEARTGPAGETSVGAARAPRASAPASPSVQRVPIGPKPYFSSDLFQAELAAMKQTVEANEWQDTGASPGFGPLDVRGVPFQRPQGANAMRGHQAADALLDGRRALTLLRASLNESGGTQVGDMTYAERSMNQWAWFGLRASESVGGDPQLIARAVRMLYDNWRAAPESAPVPAVPEPRGRLGLGLGLGLGRRPKARRPKARRDHAEEALRTLEKLSGQGTKKMRVYAQGTQPRLGPAEFTKAKAERLKNQLLRRRNAETPLSGLSRERRREVQREVRDEARQKAKDVALSHFAYRMNPTTPRPKERGQDFARLSLTMDVEKAATNAKKMHRYVGKDSRRTNQSKIMGPLNIGKRVDDAVIYLQNPDEGEAREVAEGLKLEGPRKGATPPGMDPMASGVGYAEYAVGTSSSHGSNRGEFIQAAIRARLGGDPRSVHAILRQALEGGRYNPNQPSRIETPEAREIRRREELREYLHTEMVKRRFAIAGDEEMDIEDEDDSWIDG